jgi:2-dehydropantoate 2-reductase
VSQPQLSVLVVGAGAVGQVFGRALRRGGAEVAYLVKPRHAEAARRGFTIHPLPGAPDRFFDFAVLTTLDEVGARAWDAVVLTVPTPALREPGWLEGLAARIGAATVVTLQPGLDDPDFVRARVGAERVVVGMIGLLAWAEPLGAPTTTGTAFWIPPLASCALSGPAAAPIAAALRRGGLPAPVRRDVETERAFGGALLEATVVGLDRAGWSVAALRADRALLGLVARAARESAAIVARARKVRPPLPFALLGPRTTRLILGLLARRAPVDVGAFFRIHYAKIAEQSRTLMTAQSERARALGIATPALDALRVPA